MRGLEAWRAGRWDKWGLREQVAGKAGGLEGWGTRALGAGKAGLEDWGLGRWGLGELGRGIARAWQGRVVGELGCVRA